MADSSESDTAYDPKNDSASEDEVEDVQIAKKEVNKISKKRKLTDETPESEKTLKDEKGNTYWELSGKRRITITKFSSGEKAIDIREWYKKDGESRPGKGICLPKSQWDKIVDLLPELNEALRK